MASAVAKRLDDWTKWLEKQDGLDLPWAIVTFTDSIHVRKPDGKPDKWLEGQCEHHKTGELLEARLFGDSAEVLIRWETSGKWLCRVINDGGEASDGTVALGDPTTKCVYLWGQRLGESQQWFEQRVRPIELPLDTEGVLAVADIKIYTRAGQDPIWRFSSLHAEGA